MEMTIMVAAVAQPSPVPTSSLKTPEEARRPPGVLVADDEPSVRQVMSWFLGRAGCNVWCAENGLDAVRFYSAYQPSIDLILLDVEMPTLDGCGAARVLRRLNSRVRICFMSGALDGPLTERLLDLDPVWVFPKPFPVASVVELLQQLIRVERSRNA
jgi:CheY-like chemotaxis protein